MSPLNSKGKKILKKMSQFYGSKKKAQEVFYASVEDGKITGVETKTVKPAKRKKK